MKHFLKASEVKTIGKGYLVNAKTESPVTHLEFVKAQEYAHYIATFATVAKTKDFKGKKADSLKDVLNEVDAILQKEDVQYLKTSTVIEGELTSQLRQEAMAFMNAQNQNNVSGKVNELMQQFNVINEFEDFGLFFEDGITKLNKIYTIEEILNNVTSVIDLL